jgi:hypothetical protein
VYYYALSFLIHPHTHLIYFLAERPTAAVTPQIHKFTLTFHETVEPCFPLVLLVRGSSIDISDNQYDSMLQRHAVDVVAKAASASSVGPSASGGAASSGAHKQAAFELRCRDAQTQVQTIYESTRTKHAGGVPVWLSAENLETKEGDVIEAAHAFAGAQINLILARWRLRLGGFGVDTRHASPPLREWLRCAADIEPLRVVIEERCCPFTMLKVITSIFIELDRGEILEAENHYFSLAIGSDPWRIGVYSGTMHERAKAMSLHRGTVKHVMNNDVVRRCMLAVKMLITEAGRSK